jgi:hypothetical protein
MRLCTQQLCEFYVVLNARVGLYFLLKLAYSACIFRPYYRPVQHARLDMLVAQGKGGEGPVQPPASAPIASKSTATPADFAPAPLRSSPILAVYRSLLCILCFSTTPSWDCTWVSFIIGCRSRWFRQVEGFIKLSGKKDGYFSILFKQPAIEEQQFCIPN